MKMRRNIAEIFMKNAKGILKLYVWMIILSNTLKMAHIFMFSLL